MEHTQNNSRPIDVQIDILRRLPVKSLIQYKCMSKYWRTLITSERFSKVYHQMNSNTSSPLILVGTSTILTFNFSGAQSVCKLPIPLTWFNHRTLIGSSNGLLCLQHPPLTAQTIALYNPITRDYRVLPLLKTTRNYSKHILSWDLTDVKGYLHLSIRTKFDTCRFPGIDVWIMKMYGVKQSWTKLACYSSKEFENLFIIPSTSPNLYFTRSVLRPRVYAYSKDDQEILLGVELNPKNFFSCHLKTRKVKKVEALCNLLDEEDQGFSVVPWTCTFASCE